MTTGNAGAAIGLDNTSKLTPIGGITADTLLPDVGADYVGVILDTWWASNRLSEDVTGPFIAPSSNAGKYLQWVTTGASSLTVGVAGLVTATNGTIVADVAGALKTFIAPGTAIPAGSYLWVETASVVPDMTFNSGDPIADQTPTIDVPFTLDISTHWTGGPPPKVFSIFSGSLPPGLAMNSAGVVSGTPTTLGASGNVVFKGTDGRGNSSNSNGAPFTVVAGESTLLAVAHSNTPFITVYSQAAGVFTKNSDPATLPTSTGNCCAFSPDGAFLAVGHNGSPFLTIYSVSGATLTKLPNPSSLPVDLINGVAWNASGSLLGLAHPTSPFMTVYSRSGSTFTKLANPASLPTGDGKCCAFSASGALFAHGQDGSPRINLYSVSGTTFTKLADPATLPAGVTGRGCAFAGDTFLLVSSGSVTPPFTIYSISGTTFTKLADPTPTGGTPIDASWSPDTNFMSSFLAYSRSGSTFTNCARPVFPGGGSMTDGLFSAFSKGIYLAYVGFGTPFIAIYSRSGSVFTLLSNPATLPAGTGRGVSWN